MEFLKVQQTQVCSINMAKQTEHQLWLGQIYDNFSINVKYHK